MKVTGSTTCVVIVLFCLVAQGNASLALTQQGKDDGFTLSTFVSGYNYSYGPLSQGIDSEGNVITGSALDHSIYVFKDVDNQHLSDAIHKVNYSCGDPCAYDFAMTTAAGQVYGATWFGGGYQRFNNDGTFNPIDTSGLTSNLGMWTNPVNQHIISASTLGLADIDPVQGTYRLVVPGLAPDGVTVSPDGKVAYTALNNGVIDGVAAFTIADGTLQGFWATGHGSDGLAVISGGNLNGFVVVNNNDGTVGLLDPNTGAYEIIADGGTRGDFASLDTTNGTLFLSQQDQVARLTCGPDCSFDTPEPPPIALLGTGLLCVVGLFRRKLWL